MLGGQKLAGAAVGKAGGSNHDANVLLGIAAAALMAAALLGCSATVREAHIGNDRIRLALSNVKDGDRVGLYLSGVERSLTTTVANGVATFSLPIANPVARATRVCMIPFDPKRRSASLRPIPFEGSSSHGFENTLWIDYLATRQERDRVSQQHSSIRSQLNSARRTLQASRSWLRARPAIHNNGHCIAPSRGPKPVYACAPSQQNAVATEACAAAILGCPVATEMYNVSRGSGFLERALVSQSCNGMVARMTGNRYTADAALGNLILDLVSEAGDAGLQSDNLFDNLMGAMAKVGVWAVYISKLNNCKKQTINRCATTYSRWYYAPSRAKAECQRQVQAAESASQNIASAERKLTTLGKRVRLLNAKIRFAETASEIKTEPICRIDG